MKFKALFFVVCLTLVANKPMSSPEKTITGVVTQKSDGFPLPGVDINVKGTSKVTQTDFDGKYSISATSEDVLVISYINMQTVERTVGKNRVIDIGMEEKGN
jgi:hypothetical protein